MKTGHFRYLRFLILLFVLTGSTSGCATMSLWHDAGNKYESNYKYTLKGKVEGFYFEKGFFDGTPSMKDGKRQYYTQIYVKYRIDVPPKDKECPILMHGVLPLYQAESQIEDLHVRSYYENAGNILVDTKISDMNPTSSELLALIDSNGLTKNEPGGLEQKKNTVRSSCVNLRSNFTEYKTANNPKNNYDVCLFGLVHLDKPLDDAYFDLIPVPADSNSVINIDIYKKMSLYPIPQIAATPVTLAVDVVTSPFQLILFLLFAIGGPPS